MGHINFRFISMIPNSISEKINTTKETQTLLHANKEANQKVKEEKINKINNQLDTTITVY